MTFDLHDVSVRHPSVFPDEEAALSDLTISVAQGEQIALIGPSGAGKTTLLHTLACALQPDGGTFSLFGCDPWTQTSTERHALRRRLFLAPQTPPLPARQRVITAVLAGRLPQWNLWKALVSLLKPSDPQAAFDALARFNLQDKLYERVDRLSGGERQRCSLARMLLSQAQAFLVDEPLSALDPALASHALQVLQQEASTRAATLICSLHQVDLACSRFARIVGMRGGRIVFDAPRAAVNNEMIAELYRHPPVAVFGTAETVPVADARRTSRARRCW